MRRQFGGRRQTRLWREGSKGKVDGPPGRGLWSPVGDGLCSHRGRRLKKKPAPVPVISTVAGQPPIGKPLIVQARGQLRLTWRLYAESPQSGEISLRNVANPWWQEISRLCVSLEPKVFTTHTGRSPARDDDAGEQLTVIYQKGSH